MKISSITIVVPVKDEESTLEDLYNGCATSVSELQLEFSIRGDTVSPNYGSFHNRIRHEFAV